MDNTKEPPDELEAAIDTVVRAARHRMAGAEADMLKGLLITATKPEPSDDEAAWLGLMIRVLEMRPDLQRNLLASQGRATGARIVYLQDVLAGLSADGW